MKKVAGLRVFYTDSEGKWTEDLSLDSQHLSMRDFYNYKNPKNRIHHNPPQVILKNNNIHIDNFQCYFSDMKVE